ncbi:hypothetical protein ABPG72_002070 [Tetrahymena utriculariae]
MSHSLAQKANQNYLKEYAKLKRQSLNSLFSPKQGVLHTEEDIKKNDYTYFDIQKEGVPIKLKRSQNFQKNLQNDKPTSQQKQFSSNQTSLGFQKLRNIQSGEQFSGSISQRKSLESLLSQGINNQKQQESYDRKQITSRSILQNLQNKQAQDKLNIVISDQGEQGAPISNAYGLQSALSSQNSQDQQNTSDQGLSTPVGAEIKVKPKTKQMTRSSFQVQVPYYLQKAEEKKESIRQKNKEKKIQYKDFIESLESRKQTFTKFSFKSYERDDNPFLNPLIQKVNNLELKGSMHVIDLWEDKALKKYLNYSNLKDGKYMLRGIAQQINQEQQQQKKDAPTIFTKKDEYILQGRLQDKESMNNYIKHINEEYVKNQKLLDIKIQKSGLSQAISRQSLTLPAETNFQQILPNKQNSSTKIDQEKQFDDIEFIKNFFQRTQSLAALSSPQNFQSQFLSQNKAFQTDKIKTSPSASPQKQEKKYFQNYFFPSQSQQFQISEQSARSQKQEDLTQLSGQKSQFLQVHSFNLESPNKQKSNLFNSEPQQNKFGQVQNNSYNQPFSPNGKFINSSELNSTNFLSEMKKNDLSKVTHFSSRVEKRRKQFLKIDPSKLDNFKNKNIQNNQKMQVDNYQSSNRILKTEELDASQRSSFQNPKLNIEHKITYQIEQHKILEKINCMFRQIDSIQKSDLNQKKKIDHLIEKIQDKVIVSIQNQKKKILDDDRINNLSSDAQKWQKNS